MTLRCRRSRRPRTRRRCRRRARRRARRPAGPRARRAGSGWWGCRWSAVPIGRTTTSPTEEAKIAVKLLFRVSVKISEPATNATPSTIANVLINSRSLRPSRLFQAACSITRPGRRGVELAGVHVRHPGQHLLAVRLAQLVDDPAVGEEDHPVGVGRGHRVVGDHHDGLAELVAPSAAAGSAPRRPSGSRGCRWARRRTRSPAGWPGRGPPRPAAAGRRRARWAGA